MSCFYTIEDEDNLEPFHLLYRKLGYLAIKARMGVSAGNQSGVVFREMKESIS